ncbi:MAG TPA: iron-siderophore ABC transporter substrate-binding protein [Pelagibacterium sp.]|uniref:iron-siderophore ABC transporter substrate-binding protein n=1 Tax=Pelagibacterium sp. TaxID=1967288 RepID=UPI002B5E4C02|nr:iron-siderophore ABC transporter substrate-binding protein [Pelagibacterium sp.]HWJ87698.1 iron-siderophore ABC transporter substrate-binding protein [Pelagibacterium sp.]
MMHLSRRHSAALGAALLYFALGLAPAQAQVAQVVSENEAARVVLHAQGETEVPVHPHRIVALHNIFSEALVALGEAPVGAVVRPSGLPDQLADALADTALVGDQSAPDFEAILALDPDLILAQADEIGDNYELLSAIAPTLLLDEPNVDWRQWLIGLGEAVGKPDAAHDAVDAYDAHAAAVKAQVAAVRPDDTVLVLRVREKDLRVYGGARRSGLVLYQDLGLNPHPLVDLNEDSVTVSNEIIPELTADHLFLMVEDEDKMAGIEATALWQALPAVQAGHVYRVNMEPWNRSTGPISFAAIVDDVAAHLGTAD